MTPLNGKKYDGVAGEGDRLNISDEGTRTSLKKVEGENRENTEMDSWQLIFLSFWFSLTTYI